MRAARRPHWTQERQPGYLHFSGPRLTPALFKAKPCDNYKGFLRPVSDGKLVTLTTARGWRREAEGGATSWVREEGTDGQRVRSRSPRDLLPAAETRKRDAKSVPAQPPPGAKRGGRPP